MPTPGHVVVHSVVSRLVQSCAHRRTAGDREQWLVVLLSPVMIGATCAEIRSGGYTSSSSQLKTRASRAGGGCAVSRSSCSSTGVLERTLRASDGLSAATTGEHLRDGSSVAPAQRVIMTTISRFVALLGDLLDGEVKVGLACRDETKSTGTSSSATAATIMPFKRQRRLVKLCRWSAVTKPEALVGPLRRGEA